MSERATDGLDATPVGRAPGSVALPEGHQGLPRQLTTFIGRERELLESSRALSATRVLTLSGAGGCGKTRLALALCERSLDDAPGGCFWVELAPLTDPALVGSALAAAVGVRPLPGQTPLDAALTYLEPRRALVVLDNCEHVLAEAAHVARSLVMACPELTVLATSREPLGIAGETDWRVPSLAVPDDTAIPSNRLPVEWDAVRLFVERGRKVRVDGLRATDAAAVVRICRELDGLPLAIELAAARLRLLSPEQIAEGLSDRFRLLSRGVRGALPRQQTLRGSVDWSHALLTVRERALFRRLAVFRDGFTLAAAERVGAGPEVRCEDVLEVLSALVDKSLVTTDRRAGDIRYRLLETVRQYAFERLVENGELEGARDRHRDTYLELAERLHPGMLTPGQLEVFDRLDPDAANLAQAIEWAARTAPEKALRLCRALSLWWHSRGRFGSGEDAFRLAVDASAGHDLEPLRSRVMAARAYLWATSGNFPGAAEVAEAALRAGEAIGDPVAMAHASCALGLPQLLQDPMRSQPTLERAYELARESGDDWCVLLSTQNLAWHYVFRDEPQPMRRLLDGCFDIATRVGAVERIAWHWIALGYSHYAAGEHGEARTFLERGLEEARSAGDPNSAGVGLAWLHRIDVDAGRVQEAREGLAVASRRAHALGAGLALSPLTAATAYADGAAGAFDRAARAADDGGYEPGPARYAVIDVCLDTAEMLRLAGEHGAARVRADEALGLADDLQNGWFAVRALLVLGRLACGESDWSEAQRLHRRALDAIVAGGYRLELPSALEDAAGIAAGLESWREAARLLGAARRARADLGLVPWSGRRAEVANLAVAVQEALGRAGLASASAEGERLTPDEAVAWLRRARGERKRPPGGWESLTPTEVEVVRHAAQGLTNPQIGERMFISRSTVKVHLSNVYRKLGVRNRAELAREAATRLPSVARSP